MITEYQLYDYLQKRLDRQLKMISEKERQKTANQSMDVLILNRTEPMPVGITSDFTGTLKIGKGYDLGHLGGSASAPERGGHYFPYWNLAKLKRRPAM